MVNVLPFRGLRYETEKVSHLANVTAPPYDVIDKDMQQELYDMHPANVVRLILNQREKGDSETSNSYTRAAGYFQQWQREGILAPERQPVFYAYSQSWVDEASGEFFKRKGVIGLLQLESFESGQVLPHEHTLGGPIADRLNLMKTTLGNLSQVFMLYDDPECQLESWLFDENPEDDWDVVTDPDEVDHEIQPVTDKETIENLTKLFQDKKLLIADGHHRYTTALHYKRAVREKMREKQGGEPPEGSLLSDYAMVFLCNFHDKGLQVFPTHRVLNKWPEGWDQEKFETELLKSFEKVSGGMDAGIDTFGYWAPGHSEPWQLKVKDPDIVEALPEVMQGLDVAILDEGVFFGIFDKAADEMKADHTLSFYRDEEAVQNLVDRQKAAAVFYMHAPDVPKVYEVCESGFRMPQKSTYFYPKILSGLVFGNYAGFLDGSGHSLSAHRLAGKHIESLPRGIFHQDQLPALGLEPAM
ncbi:MAG: DUF1015 domain-containing protein [Vampirovibrio sp.]|nr:DUF1015 domain-containing protein [Vampirovibrio sp.]